MRTIRTPLQRAHGFTLVEALVALLVMSIGMLGIAALFLETVKSGRTALTRTKAINLVGDLADRIRANPNADAAYAGAPADGDCADGAATGLNPCAPPVLAADDLFVWQAELINPQIGLGPGATFAVAFDPATNPDTYTITVNWPEVGEADPVTYSLAIEVP